MTDKPRTDESRDLSGHGHDRRNRRNLGPEESPIVGFGRCLTRMEGEKVRAVFILIIIRAKPFVVEITPLSTTSTHAQAN